MGIREDFYDEVVMSLGGSLVDVELEEKDILLCFNKAKRVFRQQGHNFYRNVFIKLDVTDGKDGKFKIPHNVNTVVAVLPTTGRGGISVGGGDDVFNQAIYNAVFGTGGSGSRRGCGGLGDMLLYELQEQQAKMINRRTGAGGITFNHDEFKNEIHILSNVRGTTVLLDAYVDLEDEEYMQNDWIIRWTIAEAKHILGMAYRKFSGISSPLGESSLSGSEYIAESKEEKQVLMEEIENYVDGSLDYGQITIG